MPLSQRVGVKNGWAFFRRGGRYVGVGLDTFDVTDVLEGPAAESIAATESWDDGDPDSLSLAQFLADETFFDRTPVPSRARAYRYYPPRSVLTASAHGFASLPVGDRDRLAGVARRIPSRAGLSFDDVRRMARYFMAVPPEEGDALAAVYGSAAGRAWALSVVSHEFAVDSEIPEELRDPDAEVDPGKPHQFTEMVGAEVSCAFCFRPEDDEVHDAASPNYAIAGVNPRTAHYYTQNPAGDEACEICGNPPDFTLHRQAGLANYYGNRAEHDRLYRETAEFWERQQQEGVVASGITVVRTEPAATAHEHMMAMAHAADSAVDRLFWQREGHEDEDDLAYWVTSDEADPMMARSLYVSDGRDYYELDPYRTAWVRIDRLPADTEPFEIDDETAAECIRGLVVAPGRPFDMRLADPEESQLMEQCSADVDWTMVDRSLVEFATKDDGVYTPEERSENASRQMRDKFGRFARTGVSVKSPDGRVGNIVLAEPDGRTIHVQYSPDEPAVKMDVRDVEVQNPRNQIRDAISRIEGKPRASINTPKAWQDFLLPPLDPNSMIKMVEDYPAYVEMMRAGAPGRAAAQDAYDAESKRKAEEEAEQSRKRWEAIMRDVESSGSESDKRVADVYNRISQWWKEDKARGWVASAFSDPTQSDVPPINMALVSPHNPDEVLELLSMVPVSAASSRPVLFRRAEGGKWEQDMKLLRQLQSRTPPTVVVLSPEEFQSVQEQVDAFYSGNAGSAGEEGQPPQAAPAPAEAEMALYDEFGGVPGIADTPGDIANVNRLKRYWTIGRGGAKIRWNTPGDWTRCNRYLRKYMGPRAKGYCFSGDTEFITRDGTMTLGEAAGTRQFVLTGSKDDGTTSDRGRWVEAEISSFGEQPLLRVTLSRGGIEKVVRATPEHRWFASPNGQNARRFDMSVVTTDDLRPGMVLASLRHSPIGWDETPDKLAFMAGFVYGDGSKHSPNRSIVDLWNEKMQLQDMFAGVASSISAEKELESGVLGVRVHGLPGEWKNAPTLQEDDSYLFGWLAGYLAADGSVHSNGSLVLSSKNEPDVLLVRDICNRLGIAAAVQTAHERHGYNDHPTLLHRVVLRAKTFGPNLLVRKDQRESAQRFFEKSNRGPMLRWKVVSVEDHGEVEEVFCATVPETESFALADNIWSLNCANLHKLMTGVWPGDRRNVGKKRRRHFSNYVVNTSEGVMSLTAGAAMASGEKPVVAAAEVVEGTRFRIPVLAPVGIKSGDGREFAKGALSFRDLPIPLLWQMRTEDGHNSSVIVGRIDSIDVLEDGSLGNALGVMDTGKYAREAERLIRNKFLRGVSVDLDEFEATTKTDSKNQPTMSAEDEDVMETKISPNDTKITKGRAIAATLVAKPAFQEVVIELLDEGEPEAEADVEDVPDGIYVGDPITDEEMDSMLASALVASAIPVHPPASWFSDPGLEGPTPLTVTDEGRVFGHIATWDTDHIGLPFSTRPPRSKSGYAYFQTGVLRTEEGEDLHVGQITLSGGHAPLEANAQLAAKHYDDTASAVCDVRAGEDMFGIWVSGAIRPSVTPEQIRVMRASTPSGDWRPINGRLELVAVCQVNVPGFPVTRARVASGQVYALVAAGTAVLNHIRMENGPQASLDRRLSALEAERDAVLSAKRDAVRARISAVRDERAQAARMRFASMMGEDEALFRDYSSEKRDEMAKEGIALKDGSYPIANVSDLKNAIRAYGRAKNKAAVRRHIRKRARALHQTDLIPESWSSAALVGEEFRELAVSSPADALFRDYSSEKREEMEKEGQAMKGGRYPIANVSDLKNAIHAYGRGAPDDKPAIRRHIIKRARALGKTDLIPESWSEASLVLSAEDINDRMRSLVSGGYYPDGTPWDPKRHPRDESGRFRTALATLKRGLGEGEADAKAKRRIDDAAREQERGNLDEARKAAADVLKMVDAIGAPTEGDQLHDVLRKGYRDLGSAVANMPLQFGSLAEKFRFTDLPDDLQGLIKDLLTRVESRLEGENEEKASSAIKTFISGGDVMSQPEISAELARMLRYLI